MTNVSIVTYHTDTDDFHRLMDSLMECNTVSKIYIVDHSETDAMRKDAGRYPGTVYIHTSNDGYGSGHNVALRESLKDNADYHVVINPDIYWEGDIIAHLEKYMDSHPECGQLMPKILYRSGDIQYLCKLLPTPNDLIVRRFMPFRKFREVNDSRYELRKSGYNTELEVPSLSGCFMFLRCSVLKKVGLFDERYFMYAEDIDLCRRIGDVSKTVYYPAVKVVHGYAKESYHSFRLLRIHIRSVIKYFNKWGWIRDEERDARNKKCIEAVSLINKNSDK